MATDEQGELLGDQVGEVHERRPGRSVVTTVDCSVVINTDSSVITNVHLSMVTNVDCADVPVTWWRGCR